MNENGKKSRDTGVMRWFLAADNAHTERSAPGSREGGGEDDTDRQSPDRRAFVA